MSRRSCHAAQAAATLLTITVVLSTVAHAADTTTPPAKQGTARRPARPAPGKPAIPVKPTPALFTPEMTFGEAVDILRNSTSPPLNIVVLWKEIGENAGVYRDTPIGIDGIAGLRVGQYLDLLVLSLSGSASAKIGYTVKDGVITVGTTGSLRPPKKVTRVYDISDLVAEPARYSLWLMGLGGMYGGSLTGLTGRYSRGYGANPAPGTSYAPVGLGRRPANGVGRVNTNAGRPGSRRR